MLEIKQSAGQDQLEGTVWPHLPWKPSGCHLLNSLLDFQGYMRLTFQTSHGKVTLFMERDNQIWHIWILQIHYILVIEDTVICSWKSLNHWWMFKDKCDYSIGMLFEPYITEMGLHFSVSISQISLPIVVRKQESLWKIVQINLILVWENDGEILSTGDYWAKFTPSYITKLETMSRMH